MDKNGYCYKAIATTVKKLKKAELVDHIASIIDRYASSEGHLMDSLKVERERWHQCNDHAKWLESELASLRIIRNAIHTVMLGRGHETSPKQLSLLLSTCQAGMTELGQARIRDQIPVGLREHAETLTEILDHCSDVIEHIGGGYGTPSYDDLAYALEVANGDREELLKRLGLTDFAWSMAGGASYTDVEP